MVVGAIGKVIHDVSRIENPWRGLMLTSLCSTVCTFELSTTQLFIAFQLTFASPNIIEGVYIIIFGLATAALEFQIPPQVQRYASFMFSFLGRGVCKSIRSFTKGNVQWRLTERLNSLHFRWFCDARRLLGRSRLRLWLYCRDCWCRIRCPRVPAANSTSFEHEHGQ